MDETINEMRKFVSGDHSTIYSWRELVAEGFRLRSRTDKVAEFTREGYSGMFYRFSVYKDQGFVYLDEQCVNFKRTQSGN